MTKKIINKTYKFKGHWNVEGEIDAPNHESVKVIVRATLSIAKMPADLIKAFVIDEVIEK